MCVLPMSLDRRLNRLEKQTRPRQAPSRAELERTISDRLMRRAEAPDSSVASRVAQALADGQPGHARAIITNHLSP